jgi:hypothetical protein
MADGLDARIAEQARRTFGTATSLEQTVALQGDASTRRYVRAWLRGSSAPSTVVVMILADRGIAISSEELAVSTGPATELPYVNVHNFLFKLGAAVPGLYCDASQEEGLLLLEDIGDASLWDVVQGKSPREVADLYQAAIDQLLLIQLAGTARRDDSCIAFRQSFDERLFLWEFEHFIEYGLLKRVETRVPDAHLHRMRESFAEIAAYLSKQPRYLNHRDFHSWNLFVQDGRVRVIDFQDALLAPAPYDLATLLGDRDTPLVVVPEIERRLLDYYSEQWEKHGGAAWDASELWNVYAACALQKAFKVVGRFHFLDIEKGKRGYLRYIPSTLRQIARLLRQRTDLAEVREILALYFPELRA